MNATFISGITIRGRLTPVERATLWAMEQSFCFLTTWVYTISSSRNSRGSCTDRFSSDTCPYPFDGSVPRLHDGRDVPGQFRGRVCRYTSTTEAPQHLQQLCGHHHAAFLFCGWLFNASRDAEKPAEDR